MEKKLVVITGCDSGIGESLCRVCINYGYYAVISYQAQNLFSPEPNVFAFKMDLRKKEEIDQFVLFIKDILKQSFHLECIVNNAGIALGGPIENLPMEIFRDNFEVNYFGLVYFTQNMIPLLIKSRGKIMNIGSMAGRIALPFLSPYASSKYALEGFNDSLRRELLPFGIRTVIVEPGGIATPIWNKSKKQERAFVDEKYLKSLDEFTKKFVDKGNSGMDSDRAAKDIFSIILKKNPKDRYIIAKNRFTASLPLLLPVKLLDKLFLKMFRMEYGP